MELWLLECAGQYVHSLPPLVFSPQQGPPPSLEETSSAGWAVPTQALAANVSSGEEMDLGLVAWT